jgi:hypothetical protein
MHGCGPWDAGPTDTRGSVEAGACKQPICTNRLARQRMHSLPCALACLQLSMCLLVRTARIISSELHGKTLHCYVHTLMTSIALPSATCNAFSQCAVVARKLHAPALVPAWIPRNLTAIWEVVGSRQCINATPKHGKKIGQLLYHPPHMMLTSHDQQLSLRPSINIYRIR